MTNKSNYLLILMMIIIISFPSICFSELKTIENEYCEIYLGNINNKKELEEFRQTVRWLSILNGLYNKLPDPFLLYTDECYSHVISNYLEKVVVVSHTEKSRKICDKVKITLDPEVVYKYLSQQICKIRALFEGVPLLWEFEIDNVLTKKSEKINIGLITLLSQC